MSIKHKDRGHGWESSLTSYPGRYRATPSILIELSPVLRSGLLPSLQPALRRGLPNFTSSWMKWLEPPVCFLRSFCFARIRLNPLGGHVLHHDCKSMIASRSTTFTENFVICCNQITKIFCTRYGSANASSARGPCNFGPLANLAKFRSLGSEL